MLGWNKRQISILANNLQTWVTLTIRGLTDLKTKKDASNYSPSFFFCSASFSLFIFKAMENIKKLGLLHFVIVCSTPIWKCNDQISFVFKLFFFISPWYTFVIVIPCLSGVNKINKKRPRCTQAFWEVEPLVCSFVSLDYSTKTTTTTTSNTDNRNPLRVANLPY